MPTVVSTGYITLIDVTDSEAKNLLKPEKWVVGTTGSQPGFFAIGTASENSIELGIDPYGRTNPLWKCTADGGNDADGGWNSTYFPIDASRTYRFVVFYKRNSLDGATYLGMYSNGTSHVYTLAGAADNNPYFWFGYYPPVLDRWYMIVGYVHGKDTTVTTSMGGVYDTTTGAKVASCTDFKWVPGTTFARHRAYLFYASTAGTTQYFWSPRVELCDGTEERVEDILRAVASDFQLTAMASDSIITPQEKTGVLGRWCEWYNDTAATATLPTAPTTDGKYSQVVATATAAGLWTPTTAGTEAKSFYDAMEALRSYLFTSPGVLLASSWNNNITITKATWLTLWMTADTTAEALQGAIAKRVTPPRYLGLYSYENRGMITGMIANDLAVLYSATQSERGIYAYVSSTWTKQSTPTQDQIMRCMIGVLDAVRQGYGVSADYIGAGATSFETLLVNFLYAQYAMITGSIRAGTRYDQAGNETNPTQDGVWIGANGKIKGAINDVEPDQITPSFTRRQLFTVSGTWSVPTHVKWVRVTAMGGGGGGGGSGGATDNGSESVSVVYNGGNGQPGTASSFGSYVIANGGSGGAGDGSAGAGAAGQNGGSTDYIGGYNGASGGAGSASATSPAANTGTKTSGAGGARGSSAGLYDANVELSNASGNLTKIPTISAGASKTNAASVSTGTVVSNGSAGNTGSYGGGGGGATGGCFAKSAVDDAYSLAGACGGGGGAGALRQRTFRITEVYGQSITVTVGAGGAGGAAGSGTTATGAVGGAGGNGWVLVEW